MDSWRRGHLSIYITYIAVKKLLTHSLTYPFILALQLNYQHYITSEQQNSSTQ